MGSFPWREVLCELSSRILIWVQSREFANATTLQVSSEDGLVKCFDVRAASKDPLWTLHAHDGAVSALDVCPTMDGLLVTGSADKQAKLWNIKEGKPSCLASRDLGVVSTFPVLCLSSLRIAVSTLCDYSG